MHKDLTLIPDDQPGVLARIGEAAGAAGINIEGISAFTGEGKGIVHLLVNQPLEAHKALTDAGFDVRAARDVVVVDVEDRPGAMGEVCRTLADHEVNIQQAYIATGGEATPYRLVLVVDDVQRAHELVGQPAE